MNSDMKFSFFFLFGSLFPFFFGNKSLFPFDRGVGFYFCERIIFFNYYYLYGHFDFDYRVRQVALLHLRWCLQHCPAVMNQPLWASSGHRRSEELTVWFTDGWWRFVLRAQLHLDRWWLWFNYIDYMMLSDQC